MRYSANLNRRRFSLNICLDATRDQRRYNLPTVDEVAAVLPGDGSQATAARDIVIRSRDGPLYRIDDGHPAYSCLHYVLLFPFGEDGWSFSSTLTRPFQGDTWAAFPDPVLCIPDSNSVQMNSVQFFVVVGYCSSTWWMLGRHASRTGSISSGGIRTLYERLCTVDWRMQSEVQMRMSTSGNLDSGSSCRRRIKVAPGTCSKSFKMRLTIARYYQKADLFLTMTANPKWVEILSALLPGQTSTDRPDLIARVFQLKKKALLADIYKANIFGHAVGHVHTIEFQKRGLPHMHALIFFAHPYKILNSEDVDSIVSAAWPDPDQSRCSSIL